MQVAEHTEPAKITAIPMGSPIPDWLVVADPLQAGAPKGNWRFDCDVIVIELATDIFVFPIIEPGVTSTCSVMDWSGMQAHRVYASAKTIRVIHQFNSIFPIEYAAAVDEQRERLVAEALNRKPEVDCHFDSFSGDRSVKFTPSAEQSDPGPVLGRQRGIPDMFWIVSGAAIGIAFAAGLLAPHFIQ